jgi:hypothetical protein
MGEVLVDVWEIELEKGWRAIREWFGCHKWDITDDVQRRRTDGDRRRIS